MSPCGALRGLPASPLPCSNSRPLPGRRHADAGACSADADLTSSEAVPATSVFDLWRRPELRLGESQRVIAQVCREVEDWSAFLTRFDPAAFRAFEVWADEQFLWIKEEYDAPQARLFARRGSGAAAALSAATPSTRLELDVIVREMHAGCAWIEVTRPGGPSARRPRGRCCTPSGPRPDGAGRLEPGLGPVDGLAPNSRGTRSSCV